MKVILIVIVILTIYCKTPVIQLVTILKTMERLKKS